MFRPPREFQGILGGGVFLDLSSENETIPIRCIPLQEVDADRRVNQVLLVNH